MDWSIVRKCDEIVALQRRGQSILAGRADDDERRPEVLWPRRFGKRGEGGLQCHRVLTRDGKEGGYEGFAARDRQHSEMNLRHGCNVEEIGWLRDRELAAARQRVDAVQIG